MSEYSYNYSHHSHLDHEHHHFLVGHSPLSFELDPSPQKELPAATNYVENDGGQGERRRKKVIEVCLQRQNQYILARRGRGWQTMQLHTNFKTMVRRHLRDLIYLKLLNEKQHQNCIAFLDSTPSFRALNQLLHPDNQTQKLRNSLITLFSSPIAVTQILSSGATYRQKLVMIKFLERMREALSIGERGRKWKAL